MISIQKIQAWLKEGESDHIEFKLSFGQDVIETLGAFANVKGGMVLLGISDAGEIKGVSLAKESINQWVNEIKSKTAPQLIPDAEVVDIQDKTIVCFAIAEYPVKPVAYRGRYYRRVTNTNHLMSTQEVVNAHLQSVNSSWDFYIRPNKNITQISLDKVNRQIEIINQRRQVSSDDPLTFLRKFSLIDGENITNACWLMFLPDQELVYEQNLQGNIAEGGVFEGEFAKYMNQYFHDRKFYLFDTFEGFDDRDVAVEANNQFSVSMKGHLTSTIDKVKAKMPLIGNCVFRPGYFPESAYDINDEFVFVNLDFDLYNPTLAGLEFFYPKMVKNGILLIHDYFSDNYKGVKQAVDEFSKKECIPICPIGDGISIAIIKY